MVISKPHVQSLITFVKLLMCILLLLVSLPVYRFLMQEQKKNAMKIIGPKLWNKQLLSIRDSP